MMNLKKKREKTHNYNPYNKKANDCIDFIKLKADIIDPNIFGWKKCLDVQISRPRLEKLDLENEDDLNKLGMEFAKKLAEKLR